MDENLNRRYHRWFEADESGRDDDADAVCRAMFAGALEETAVSPHFTARTLAAIATATARDARRSRWVRQTTVAGGAAAAAAGIYVGGGWMLWAMSAMVIGLIEMLVRLTVRVATGLQAGVDVWTVLAGLGRAAAAFVADPAVTVAMLAMQGIAVAALIALQRLLGSDRESFK